MKTNINLLRIILLLLCGFIFFQILLRAANSPIDFDEGYNLQISRNVWLGQIFSTYEKKWDSQITTGPTVLLPASIFVNSSIPQLPRLIIVIYTLLLIYFVSKEYFSLIEKVLFVLMIQIFPIFFFFATRILGELPGFLFLVVSIGLLIKRKTFLSGIFLSLAFLTKIVYLIGLFPVLYLLLSDRKIKRIDFIFGSIWPIIVWEIGKLISLKFNITQYINLFHETISFIGTIQKQNIAYLIPYKFKMIEYVFNINSYLFLGATLLIDLYIIFIYKKKYFFKALAVFYLTYLTYFFFFCNTNWYRHFFPAILSFITIFPIFIIYISNNFKKKGVLIFLLTAIFLLTLNIQNKTRNNSLISRQKLIEQNLIFSMDGYLPPLRKSVLLDSQLRVANYINRKISLKDDISGISWWNAPEISYITGRKIGRNPYDSHSKFLISHFYGQLLAPWLDKELKSLGKQTKVFGVVGYELYEKK